jgi:hypothetical protein
MNTIQPFEVRKLLNELHSQADLSDAKIGRAVLAPASIITRLRTGVIKSTEVNRGIRIANFHAQIFKSENKQI